MIKESDYSPVECVNIPKILFQEKQYEKLSVDAKLLYSLLLDRKNVAAMNGWVDRYGTAYVIYPKSEMKKHLNASRYRVDMALEELENCGQMVLVTQPNPGRPCQIYVKDITADGIDDMEEKAMCMMMKEPNGRNEKQIMRPCMGIPGMQGVALFFDPEDLMRATEAMEGADEGAVLADACDLGEELGLAITALAEVEEVDAFALYEYMGELDKAGKKNQLRAVVKALSLMFGVNEEYIEEMECCRGHAKEAYLRGVMETAADLTKTAMKRNNQE